jgi:hypothetical protein
MRTLRSVTDRRAIIERISALASFDLRLWGRMTAHQTVCHLSDSFKAGLGERAVSTATLRAPRPLYKWIALRVPLKWPKGVPTRPEVEQGAGGTAPGEFDLDRAELVFVLNRFCDDGTTLGVIHPIFGPMTREDWLRWGYLHADHHLRQFGR